MAAWGVGNMVYNFVGGMGFIAHKISVKFITLAVCSDQLCSVTLTKQQLSSSGVIMYLLLRQNSLCSGLLWTDSLVNVRWAYAPPSTELLLGLCISWCCQI